MNELSFGDCDKSMHSSGEAGLSSYVTASGHYRLHLCIMWAPLRFLYSNFFFLYTTLPPTQLVVDAF